MPRVDKRLSDLAAQPLAKAGLPSLKHYTLLYALSDSHLNQTAMSDILAVSKNTVVNMLDLLSQRGLVERVRGQDRRENVLQITPKGRRTLERGAEIMSFLEAEVRRELSADEWDTLVRVMYKLSQLLS